MINFYCSHSIVSTTTRKGIIEEQSANSRETSPMSRTNMSSTESCHIASLSKKLEQSKQNVLCAWL